jgi:DUF177 domain-containing protein
MKRPDTISLESIVDEPVRFAFELPLPAESLDREPLVALSPVRFTGEVSKIEGGYSLDGDISYRGELECSRCLNPYPFEEKEHFSLTLYPRTAAVPGERALEKSDLDAYFYEDSSVAVAPIVEERIQLAVPMKPLCRLPRTLRSLRRGSQFRTMRMRARNDRSSLGGAEGPPFFAGGGRGVPQDQQESVGSECRIPNDATAKPAATSAARTTP